MGYDTIAQARSKILEADVDEKTAREEEEKSALAQLIGEAEKAVGAAMTHIKSLIAQMKDAPRELQAALQDLGRYVGIGDKQGATNAIAVAATADQVARGAEGDQSYADTMGLLTGMAAGVAGFSHMASKFGQAIGFKSHDMSRADLFTPAITSGIGGTQTAEKRAEKAQASVLPT